VGDLTISGCEGRNYRATVLSTAKFRVPWRFSSVQSDIKEDTENLLENQNTYPVVKTRYAVFWYWRWGDKPEFLWFATKEIAEALALNSDKTVLDGLLQTLWL
jgi:hypothetical protein